MEVNSEQTKENKEDYILTRLANLFGITKQLSIDKFKKSKDTDLEGKKVFDSFCAEKDFIDYFIAVQSGEGSCSFINNNPALDKLKIRKGVLVCKVTNEALTHKNVSKDVAFIEIHKNVLEHLYNVFHYVMGPILQNPLNQVGWAELISKDLMESFNNYIAQCYIMIGLIKGKTMLPLPAQRFSTNDQAPDKDKAYIFESAIITWTKQIKNLLKIEPEQALKKKKDPGPLTEIEFWENKSKNLNFIHEQLQAVEVKNILRFLEGNKSTYTNPFSKLQKDVQNSRIEANDNVRFLTALKPWFQKLEESKDFTSLFELFIPIMHTILLIWKHSKYYNTTPRLVILIREICNAIINKAREFVSGETIFAHIQSEEAHEACEKLQVSIDICTKFKDAYFEYKAQSDSSWKLTTNALFMRLDTFLER